MKILYIAYVTPGSGPWIHASHFFNELKKLNPEAVSYPHDLSRQITPSVCLSSSSWKKIFYNKLKIIRIIKRVITTMAGQIVPEWRIIAKYQPDIILVRGGESLASVLIAAIKRIPICYEMNGPVSETPLFASGFSRKCGECFERIVLLSVNHIFVVSTSIVSYLTTFGIQKNAITVIPNGVNIEQFSPIVDRIAIRSKYNLNDSLVIGFSGNFSRWHGLDFLNATINTITDHHKKRKLFLIGNPKSNYQVPSQLQQQAIMTGYVPHGQMPQYLAAVDIYVIPYPLHELFYFSPLKLYEAMAMGLAIIASAQGQITEVLHHDHNGVLYEPDNCDSFIAAINRLSDNNALRKKLGTEARKTVEHHYTWAHNAEKIHTVLKKMFMESRCG